MFFIRASRHVALVSPVAPVHLRPGASSYSSTCTRPLLPLRKRRPGLRGTQEVTMQ